MADFRQSLRKQRARAGLSFAELSSVTGISRPYLVRLENDSDANPSLDVLHRLAEALDVTIAELVGRPAVTIDTDSIEIPSTLRAYADEVGLPRQELVTLASIRWRRGEEPQTTERWRFLRDSLRASRTFDQDDAS
jgi:transcriptional regulator with XRE-family HTH domain